MRSGVIFSISHGYITLQLIAPPGHLRGMQSASTLFGKLFSCSFFLKTNVIFVIKMARLCIIESKIINNMSNRPQILHFCRKWHVSIRTGRILCWFWTLWWSVDGSYSGYREHPRVDIQNMVPRFQSNHPSGFALVLIRHQSRAHILDITLVCSR